MLFFTSACLALFSLIKNASVKLTCANIWYEWIYLLEGLRVVFSAHQYITVGDQRHQLADLNNKRVINVLQSEVT